MESSNNLLIHLEYFSIEFFSQIVQMIPSIVLTNPGKHRHYLATSQAKSILLFSPFQLTWIHRVENNHCEVSFINR